MSFETSGRCVIAHTHTHTHTHRNKGWNKEACNCDKICNASERDLSE